MRRVALVPDGAVKIGASLGYNVRTLLKDLGLEVTLPPPRGHSGMLQGEGGGEGGGACFM